MRLSTAELIVIGVAAGLLVVVLIGRALARRSLCRRLAALSSRLGDEELGLEARRVEAGLANLERMVDLKVAATGEAVLAAARLQRVLSRVHQGVLVGNEAGEVVFRNARASDLLGGAEPDAGAEQAIAGLLRQAAEGRAQERTITVGGPPPRTLEVAAAPLDDQWRTIGGVALVDDATEQHQLEAVRRDFVANISHELKTPVGALALLAETLADEGDAVVAHRLARRLQAEAQRVGRVIDDLIDLTRIQSEETPTREPVAVHLVVAQAAERVRAAAQDKGITINFGEPPQRLWVLGDRRQLVTAVYNLLDNAVKYSPAGSVVEVRARSGGDGVELSVRDRGVGIPARDHDRIFERFYRVEQARAANVAGTGLGLAIVRHVVVNHGGKVTVESSEGRGSTFTLRLPGSAGVVAAEPPAKAG